MLRIGAAIVAATAALAFTSSAGARAQNIVFPFEAVEAICGDEVHISGDVLGTFVLTETPNGGATLITKFNPQGVTGVSLVTGALYRAVGVTTFMTVFAPGVTSDTYVNRFFLIGTGGAPKSLFSETVHVTIHADGTVSASVDKFSNTCVG
jgi:hypothetical protein